MFLTEVNNVIGNSNYVVKRSALIVLLFLCSAYVEFLFIRNTNDFIASLVNAGVDGSAIELPSFFFLLILTTFLKLASMYFLNYFVQFMRVKMGDKLILSGMVSKKTSDTGTTVALLSSELDNLVGYYFLPLFNIVFSVLTLSAVVFAALSEYPFEGAIILGVGACAYVTIYFTTRKTIKWHGEIRSQAAVNRIGFLAAVLPISLLFKLNSNIDSVATRYSKYNRIISKAFVTNSLLSVMPKHLLEFLGFCSVAFALYINSNAETNNPGYYMPMIGTLMVVSVRILPPMQLIFQNYNQLLFANPIITKFREELTFKHSIESVNYSKRFSRTVVLKNVNACLPSGSYIDGDEVSLSVGEIFQICGPSGSGKTSLLQAIALQDSRINYLGADAEYIEPQSMRIGYSLQNNSYFPGSIYENITLDLDGRSINLEHLRKVMSVCQLDRLLERSDLTIYEEIGGNRKDLSGGEKQRIALARALFNVPDLLLIDEGTSGIEDGLEAKILQDIVKNFPNTIILITSHRELNYSAVNKIQIRRDQR